MRQPGKMRPIPNSKEEGTLKSGLMNRSCLIGHTANPLALGKPGERTSELQSLLSNCVVGHCLARISSPEKRCTTASDAALRLCCAQNRLSQRYNTADAVYINSRLKVRLRSRVLDPEDGRIDRPEANRSRNEERQANELAGNDRAMIHVSFRLKAGTIKDAVLECQ